LCFRFGIVDITTTNAPLLTYRHRRCHFLRGKDEKYWRNNIQYIQVFCIIFGVLEYDFISSVPDLEYLFPLAVGFFKVKLKFPTLFVVPPLLL
jgi:hypothetical protein